MTRRDTLVAAHGEDAILEGMTSLLNTQTNNHFSLLFFNEQGLTSVDKINAEGLDTLLDKVALRTERGEISLEGQASFLGIQCQGVTDNFTSSSAIPVSYDFGQNWGVLFSGDLDEEKTKYRERMQDLLDEGYVFSGSDLDEQHEVLSEIVANNFIFTLLRERSRRDVSAEKKKRLERIFARSMYALPGEYCSGIVMEKGVVFGRKTSNNSQRLYKTNSENLTVVSTTHRAFKQRSKPKTMNGREIAVFLGENPLKFDEIMTRSYGLTTSRRAEYLRP